MCPLLILYFERKENISGPLYFIISKAQTFLFNAWQLAHGDSELWPLTACSLYHKAEELITHEATKHGVIAEVSWFFGSVLHDQCPLRG